MLNREGGAGGNDEGEHGPKLAVTHWRLIAAGPGRSLLQLRLETGRKNQIRVMFQHFGRLVEKLRRVKIGFLELDLAPGRFRTLTTKEVERFRKLLKLAE